MADGLDVIVIDDDPGISQILKELIESFYTWGRVVAFSDAEKAIHWCLKREVGLGIFVVDVFLKGMSGFYFLESIEQKFPSAHEDAIVVSGKASDDVVDMCLASRVTYLLEKPIRPYALQLAVRAITAKYLDFAQKLLRDPELADSIRLLHPNRTV
ncbi:MAG TPA: response regulator [Desulfobacterales bacterium]|nr:response regulator [Desulfobacterales bacterium]